jgi:hypothetical protein
VLPVVDLSLIFTCGLPSRGDRFVAFDGLADVVVCGGMSIAGARWAAGAGSAGFRCAGQQRRGRADVPKPATDPGRGQPVRGCWAFPGAAQIGDQRSGQAQLDMRGDDQPGPAVGRGRGPDLRAGPAEGLLRLVASRNTPSDSTGQAGRSTRPASTSTTPIEPFSGWPGARSPRSPSASACRHRRRDDREDDRGRCSARRRRQIKAQASDNKAVRWMAMVDSVRS